MVSCNAFLSGAFEQSSSGVISWKYVDDSSGDIIDPDTFSAKLFDVNDVQRDPSNTANTASGSFTPTKDIDGTVTGTVGKYYINVSFDSGAAGGTWYVETTFTWESVQRTKNICFTVTTAGGSVEGDNITNTAAVYAHPVDLRNFLLDECGFDVNSNPHIDEVENYIILAEGEFEDRTGTAFKPVFVQHEIHDMQAWRNRHREIFHDSWFAVPRPLHLRHRPVLPLDTTRGHRVEVYEGATSNISAALPEGLWPDYLVSKSAGRENDFWLDEQRGHLYIRKTFLFRRASLVRVSYEYGKPIYKTTAPVSTTDQTISTESTHRYQTRGIIRIGGEYIFHTGKTNTSFTGCRRGMFRTQAVAHNTNSEVYEVPDHVRQLIVKRAASHMLSNDRFLSTLPDGATASMPVNQLVQRWDQEWNKEIGTTYQRIRLV